jgi:CheY-like chemotaxis protein
VIRSLRAMSIGGTPACSYTLADGTGQLDLLFLGRVEVAGLAKGRRCRAEGMVAVRDDRNVIWNPRYWIEPEDQRAGVRGGAGQEPLSGLASRVLVVDDDNAIRRVLAVSLKAHGYQVDLASTGQEALALAGQDTDLILLDIGLPDIDGLMAIREIQEECDAPVIVLSASETIAARTAALAAGAVDYLPKPFSIEGLLAKIREMAPPPASQSLAGIGAPARG